MRLMPTFVRTVWASIVTTVRAAFNQPPHDLRVAYCRLAHNAALALIGGEVALLFHHSMTAVLAISGVSGATVLFFTGASFLAGVQE